jgi:signal transduction histidine kinase
MSRKITDPIRQLRESVEITGSGDLNHRVRIETGDEIEELAEEFNRMTEALQNSYVNLEQKVQQRTQEVSALYEVTSAVNQSLDLDLVLEAVIKKITQIFHFETTRIFLYDNRMQELRLRAYFQTHPEPWAQISSVKRGESAVGRVAASGEPLLFEDIQSDPRYLQLSTSKAAYKVGMRFLFVFPIKTKSRVFGAIAFSGKERRRLTGEEIRLLHSMSEHVGVAVEKANLFEQVKERSEHLAVLNTIAAAVSQSLDLEVVLKEAVEKITETLCFDASWIYILDPAKGHLRLKAFKGVSVETAQSMDPRPVAAGVSGKIFETGEAMVFEDVQNDAYYQNVSSRSRVSSLGFVTSGGFPIRAKDKVIGVLHIANRVRRQIAVEESRLLESIAQEIGVAADNARLFAELNEKTSELVKANQELVDATRAKSEFIAAMSHELRTPLNIIIGNSDLTRDGFFGDLNPEQTDALQKVSRNARVLLKMINDVLAFSRIEAKKMSLDIETVDVDEIIKHARTHVDQINRDRHLEVRWVIDPNIPPLTTDPIKLEEILQNLIGNAFKFTPTGRVEVRVRNLCDQERVQFSVSDTGIGIEPENVGKIFNEFEQIKEAHTGNFSGVGLGLSIVKKYLELMQGEIQVESKPGEGSTFTFFVPHSVSLNS